MHNKLVELNQKSEKMLQRKPKNVDAKAIAAWERLERPSIDAFQSCSPDGRPIFDAKCEYETWTAGGNRNWEGCRDPVTKKETGINRLCTNGA